MKASLWNFHHALWTLLQENEALRALGNQGVHARVPYYIAYPYIILNKIRFLPFKNATSLGKEVFYTIEVYSSQESMKEIMLLVNQLEHFLMTLPKHSFEQCVFMQLQEAHLSFMQEEKLWKATMEYKVTFEEREM